MANGKTGAGSRLLYWIILGILGLIIIIGQQFIKEVLLRIIGIGLIAATALGVYSWWREGDRSPQRIALLIGLVAVFALGWWITINPALFDKVINVVIGLIVIIMGVQWLARGWKMDRSIPVIGMGAVACVLGLIIACNNAATTWVVVLEGVGLLYTAIIGIINELVFSR